MENSQEWSPHDKFARCEPLIKQWLLLVKERVWRVEGFKYLPNYDETVTAMAKNGWDSNTLVDLLNELTDGRFSRSPEIFADPTFNHKLSQAIMVLIQPATPGNEQGISFFWPIKLQMLETDFPLDDKVLGERHRQELQGNGPNSPDSAINFANRIINGRLKGLGPREPGGD